MKTPTDHTDGYHADRPDPDCFPCVKALENAHADGLLDATPHADCPACVVVRFRIPAAAA
jgi:hypothetical protein